MNDKGHLISKSRTLYWLLGVLMAIEVGSRGFVSYWSKLSAVQSLLRYRHTRSIPQSALCQNAAVGALTTIGKIRPLSIKVCYEDNPKAQVYYPESLCDVRCHAGPALNLVSELASRRRKVIWAGCWCCRHIMFWRERRPQC